MSLTAAAVVVNWGRSQNLTPILGNFARIPEVREIVIWNNAPALSPHDLGLHDVVKKARPDWPPIRVMGTGKNVCTWGRYLAAKECFTRDFIVTCDDDYYVQNWRHIVAEFKKHRNRCCIVAGISPWHFETRKQRIWRRGREDMSLFCQEALVGWGAAFAQNTIGDIFKPYISAYGEDPVLYREADRIFSIGHGCRHELSVASCLAMQGERSREALYLQPDHETMVAEVRRRALGLFDVPYEHKGI